MKSRVYERKFLNNKYKKKTPKAINVPIINYFEIEIV